eukprot:10047869-Lingulodinium_polyedra.AAC.1
MLLNTLLCRHFDPLVQQWVADGLGFRFDAGMPLTHAFWADNLVFFASTIEQAEVMAAGATAALGAAGLQWKPSSLELLWSDAV